MKYFKSIEIIGSIMYASFWLFFGVCYIGNIVKLTKCDFASPYKGEIEHAVGIVIPPVSFVTFWLDDK